MAATVLRTGALVLVLAAVCGFLLAAADATPTPTSGRILFASNRAENLSSEVFAVDVDRYSRRNLTRTLLQSDYGPRPSPDGRRILFRRGFAGEAPIFVMERDGSSARQVGVGANPVWSPDGTQIAYNDLRGNVFVINTDGSGVRRATAGVLPSWSPDGSRLAFVRNEGGRFQFFVVDADGGNERRLAPDLAYGGVVTDPPHWSPVANRLVVQSGDVGGRAYVTVIDVESGRRQQLEPGVHPRWAPDGSMIAFARQTADGTSGIGLVWPDGSRLSPLTTGSANAIDDYPTWSPFGPRLAFVRWSPALGDQIFVVDVDRSGLRRVTRESSHSKLFHYDEPAWLDEQTILFASLLVDNDFDLFAMEPNGRGLTRLTNNDADERQAVWSPDGRRIAVARTERVSRRSSIWMLDSNRRRARRLTPRWVEPAASPSWSPDGRRLAFVGVYRHAAALYVIDVDGKRLARVRGPSAGGIEGISVDWSPDGKQLVYAWEPGPLQIFSVPVHGGRARRLTGSPGAHASPRWSPDSRTIAFVSTTSCGRNCEIPSVATMTAAGRQRRRLVENAFDPAWSPDGRQLVFSLNGRIAVARRDGSNMSILTAPGVGLDGYPDWRGPPRTTR